MSKYRIVELDNGSFVIQEKTLFWWNDSYDALGFIRRFYSKNEALGVFNQWEKNKNAKNIKTIIKEIEL